MSLQKANEVAILAGGQRGAWVLDTFATSPSGAPVGPLAGGLIRRSVTGRALALPRLDSSRREVIVEVAAYDASATYTVGINFTPHSVSPGVHTNAQELLDLMRDTLVTFEPRISTVALDANGEPTSVIADMVALRLRGVAADDYFVELSATGTGQLSGLGDAAGADVAVWLLPGGDTGSPQVWSQVESFGVNRRGGIVTIDTRTAERIYLEAIRVDGVLGDVGITPRVRLAASAMRPTEL